MPMLRLNDGNKIPCLGFGTWQIPQETTAATVSAAIEGGYRLFDGAALYGNEAGLGEAIRNSNVARDQFFVTTKIWNDRHGHDETLRAYDESVERLGIEPDMVLIHWPCPAKDLYVNSWRALMRLREEGRVKSIGVSNFCADHLERIIGETGVTPVVNQIELHPLMQQTALRALHDRLGIVTQSWAPLGKSKCFDAEPIVSAAMRSGKTPAQVILRWHVQQGCSAIPRSVNPERQAQNADIFDFALTEVEMSAIATMEAGTRFGPDPLTFV